MSLRVGGYTPLSSIDFPGQLAAVVFCQGCPWRCAYCHNPHLLVPGPGSLDWTEILAFLRRRVGLLDAVVFSGGEPTLQGDLPGAMVAVRALGFRVGLHTAGMYPQRLARCLPYLDWVGLDVKAPLARYDDVTGVSDSARGVAASLGILAAWGGRWEVRTTVHPALLTPDDVRRLAATLAASGVRDYVLQRCRANDRPLDVPWLEVVAEEITGRFESLRLRG